MYQKTVSTTRITPLVAPTSALITLADPAADLIDTDDHFLNTSTSSPPKVWAVVIPCGRSPDRILLPAITCLARTAIRASLSSSKDARVSEGIFENALLVGAKTVKGPSAERASTSPAAETAARRVEKLGFVETISGMDCSGADFAFC